MLTSLQSLVPVFVYFVLGVMLRATGVASREHAQFLLRLVFFVTLPVLAFGAVANSDLTAASLALPATAFLVNVLCALAAFAYVRIAKFESSVAGSMVLGASVANVAFMIPFVAAGFGPTALATLILYDVGNAIFVATGAYLISSRFGTGDAVSMQASLVKMLRTPLLLAVLVAATLRGLGWSIPGLLETVLKPVGAMTAPLVLIAMGALFSTTRLRSAGVYGTVIIRMAGGLVAGWLLVVAFGLHGVVAVTVVAAASAPIGFNTVTLASISKLDVDHAAASLFVSVMVGLVTASVFILAGGYWLN